MRFALIAVQNLEMRQGQFTLANISLTIPTGQYGVLMGKTGCGKTSILEAVAGLRRPLSGSIRLGDQEVLRLPPAARGIGYVPQDAALFPTMSIRDHLAFALMIRKEKDSIIAERVRELADWLQIGHLLERRPMGLSGGEAQRVALGRALSFRPRYLLMDEPLSSLDESTRGDLIDVLLDIRKRGEVTVLHVTHSRSEAERLADVLFRIDDGKVLEVSP